MAGVFLFLLSLAFSPPGHASVRTMSESGRPIYWNSPNITFYGNPDNASGLSPAAVFSNFDAAFSAWERPENRIHISYGQNTSNPANSDYDGYNTVYFATNGDRTLESNVVALTEVLYFVNSGQIAEADLVFNDRDFKFTNVKGDTGGTSGTDDLVYLGDVATHEAGHALGLDHSAVNLSSLFYTAFSGQFEPNDDDHNILAATYPAASAPRGVLTGTVRGANAGIFGTQVSAVNLITGKVQAAALANPDGSFRLSNLPDASYVIFMEPLLTSIDSIAAYFKNIDHRFCGPTKDEFFRRGFYGPCGGTTASVVQIIGGSSVHLNTLAPSCSAMNSPAPNLIGTPYALSGPGSVYGVLQTGQRHFYRLNGVNGVLKARALSFSLYSLNDVSVKIRSSLGFDLGGDDPDVAPARPGIGTNYDSQAEVTFTGQDAIIEVTMDGLIPHGEYPGGDELRDESGHYLLSLAIDDDYGAAPPTTMETCRSIPNVQQNAFFKASAPAPSKGGGCGSLGGPGASGGPGGGLTLLFTSAFLLQGYFWAKRRPRLRLKLVRRRR